MGVYTNLPIILSLIALVSLCKVIFWYDDGWLTLQFELVAKCALHAWFIECGRGLSVLVRISIVHPYLHVQLDRITVSIYFLSYSVLLNMTPGPTATLTLSTFISPHIQIWDGKGKQISTLHFLFLLIQANCMSRHKIIFVVLMF